jgi:hypothetical protein
MSIPHGAPAYSERLDNTNRRDPIWNILNFDYFSCLGIYKIQEGGIFYTRARFEFCFFSLFLLLN